MAAWVYPGSKDTYRTIASRRESYTSGEFTLIYNVDNDRFSFSVMGAGGAVNTVSADSLGSPQLSTWYFVVGWVDAAAGKIRIQVNNGPVNEAAKTVAVGDTMSAFRVGGQLSPANYFWDGRIDSVSVWGRVLTGGERAELYNGGAGQDPTAGGAGTSSAATI